MKQQLIWALIAAAVGFVIVRFLYEAPQTKDYVMLMLGLAVTSLVAGYVLSRMGRKAP